MKKLIVKFLTGNALFLTPFKGAENRFSVSCRVCTTDLTKYVYHMEKHIG